MNDLSVFKYSPLPADVTASLKARAERIRQIRDRAVIEVGRELAEAQAELASHGDGVFQLWAEMETGLSKSTVYNLINTYKRFGDRPNFGQLPLSRSALYLLAAPSTPEEAVEEVIERAGSGGSPTVQEVRGAA